MVVPDERPWTGAARPGRAAAASAPAGQGGRAARGQSRRRRRVEPRAGMGVVFDAGRPEDKNEPGGPIFRVERRGDGLGAGLRPPGSGSGARGAGPAGVGHERSGARAPRRGPDRGRASPRAASPLELKVAGAGGAPLRCRRPAPGDMRPRRRESARCSLAAARAAAWTRRCCATSSARFGGTPFRLAGARRARRSRRGCTCRSPS